MSHTIIIAEAGVNHNGSLKMAKQLVDVAKNAGADYVKFQTSVPEKVISVLLNRQSTRKSIRESEKVSWIWFDTIIRIE